MTDEEREAVELEAYDKVLRSISAGDSLATIRANFAAGKYEPEKTRTARLWKWLGDNVSAIVSIVVAVTGLVVAISGIIFSHYQSVQNENKIASDFKISKAQLINKLSPPLSSDKPQIRTIAFYSLVSMEILDATELAEIADEEVLENLANKYQNKELKDKASLLLAERAEKERGEFSKASDKKDYDAAQKFLERAEKSAQKATVLNPENRNAFYQLGRAQQELGKREQAIEIFENLGSKVVENDEMSAKVSLNLVLLYDQVGKDPCDQSKKTVELFTKAKLKEYLAENESEFHQIWEKCDATAESQFKRENLKTNK